MWQGLARSFLNLPALGNKCIPEILIDDQAVVAGGIPCQPLAPSLGTACSGSWFAQAALYQEAGLPPVSLQRVKPLRDGSITVACQIQLLVQN